MQQLENYLSFIGVVLGLIVSNIAFISKNFKNAKARKIASQFIKFSSDIIPYIKEAESFIHYTGQEKKAYVMARMSHYLNINKMNIEVDTIAEYLDDLIDFTKQVNVTKNAHTKELKKLKE